MMMMKIVGLHDDVVGYYVCKNYLRLWGGARAPCHPPPSDPPCPRGDPLLAFAIAGPRVWNSLPPAIGDPSLSPSIFGKLLKTYLFV